MDELAEHSLFTSVFTTLNMKWHFTITVNNENFQVRELYTFEDSIVYEIWYRHELQFIISYYFDEHDRPVWATGAEENCNMGEAYLKEIGEMIESYYKFR